MAVEAHQATTENSVLLGPLSALARQKKTWAPELLAGVVWRGLTNFGVHRQVLRLLKLPLLAEAARNNPRFAFKYLTHDYLVRGLTTAQRASCFLHHYQRLHATLPNAFLREALRGETLLHEINTGSNRFAVSMGLSRDFDKEGELSLNLHVDGEIVFLLAFTIVPGAVVESDASEVLLISRLQGMKGVYRQVHLATRALHNVAPGALLLSVLQGIALAFGIGHIAAVTAARQSSYTADSAAIFKQAYDEFFTGLGIPENAAGFFLTPVPVELKPLAHVKKGHKIRTKEKRAFKQQVQSDCAAFFTERIQNRQANPGPTPA